MNLEDELLNVLKRVNMFGGAGSKDTDASRLLASMVKDMELGMLKRLRGYINGVIVDAEQQHRTSWKTEGFQYGSTVNYGDLDPFEILGVDMNATEEVVKSAYRKKAYKSHPDHGGSHEDMVKVNAAWEAIQIFKGWNR